MAQAYVADGMADQEATFSLFFRALPPGRNFLLACGLESVLSYLEGLCFDEDSLSYLSGVDGFAPPFLDWLRAFRFGGEVRAVPEGTPVFPDEPVLEITAPIAQAQVVETCVMNHVHYQTLAASKAARVVAAAAGRRVVDFGARRIHGVDAAIAAVRAYAIAGIAGTSNVEAGRRHGVPVVGTMAHSYVQAFASEAEAFRAFAAQYPGTTLLVDTYDTLGGVKNVIQLAREMGDAFSVGAVRLDSGDIAALATAARALLDEAGLNGVQIFASGGLDETTIAAIVARGAPVDAFGVGTRMGTSEDAPSLECVYKLTAFSGAGRLKLSPGKRVLPGPKQVWRAGGAVATGDVLSGATESFPGTPLLVPVMTDGRRRPETTRSLAETSAYAKAEVARLPAAIRALDPAPAPYPVEISPGLQAEFRQIQARVRR